MNVAAPDLPERLVLYDGTCGFCHGSVRWLLAHDPDEQFLFAPLQGETVARLRDRGIAIPPGLDSLVFVDRGTVSLRGRAVARIAGYLRWPWRALAVLRLVPLLPDLGYRVIARLRYALRGRVDVCALPQPGARARFLA